MKAFISSVYDEDGNKLTWTQHPKIDEAQLRKEHDPKELAKQSALSVAENQGSTPTIDADALTPDEKSFLGFVSDYLSDLSERSRQFANNVLVTAENLINSNASDLQEGDISKSRIAHMKEQYNEKIDRIQGEQFAKLKPLANERIKERAYKNAFIEENNLGKRPAVYPESHIFSFSLILISLLIEALVNAKFYAEANPAGLIGGSATAFFLSLGNVAISFILGLVCLRYLNHINRIQKILAFIGTIISLCVLFFLHLAIGHYRELLLSDPDNAYRLVLPAVVNSPFGIKDIESFVMILLGIAVTVFVIYKGYNFDDAYPGYGKVWRRWKEKEDSWEEGSTDYRAQMNTLMRHFQRDKDAFEKTINKRTKHLNNLQSDFEVYRENTVTTIEGTYQKCVELCLEYRRVFNNIYGGERDLLSSDTESLLRHVKQLVIIKPDLNDFLSQKAEELALKKEQFEAEKLLVLGVLNNTYNEMTEDFKEKKTEDSKEALENKAMQYAQELHNS